MRLVHAVFAVAGVLGLSGVALYGRQLAGPEPVPATQFRANAPTEPVRPPADMLAPDARPVAATDLPRPKPEKLERVEPRAPLSELSLALPPKPRMPEWKGALLARPVAASAGVVDAMGYHLTIADVNALEVGERCGEAKWPCGVLARTAFRAWLRGRSIECDLPPKTPPGIVTAHCKLGKQDAGAWLVANGWARPAGGLYAEELAKAKAARAGMWVSRE